jgi:hypothetical protein
MISRPCGSSHIYQQRKPSAWVCRARPCAMRQPLAMQSESLFNFVYDPFIIISKNIKPLRKSRVHSMTAHIEESDFQRHGSCPHELLIAENICSWAHTNLCLAVSPYRLYFEISNDNSIINMASIKWLPKSFHP